MESSRRSSSSRKTGSCSYASRKRPTLCAPCPGKSSATLRSANGPCANTAPGTSCTGALGAAGAMRSEAPSPRFSSARAQAESFSESVSNESATTARRASPWARCERVKATSGSVRPSRCSSGRASASCRANFATTEARELARKNSSARALRGGRRARTFARRSGASSSARCALVPPKPNELTPARRGWPFASQAISLRGRKKGPVPSSRRGFSSLTPGCGGNLRWCKARAALIRPAIPEADMVWPMFALTLPRAVRAPSRGVQPASSNSLRSAPTSTTSPTVVAVPCASTYPTVAGEKPASW